MTDARSVTIGGEAIRVERVSARKASRALALLRHISRQVPGLATRWAEAEAEYRRTHVDVLSRAEARIRFPDRPLITSDAEGLDVPVREPETLEDGKPNPRAGDLIMVPSPISRMTEADWENSNQRLELAQDPPNPAPMVMAVLDDALELAEEHVYKLLALFTISNEDVARFRKEDRLDEELEVRADRLLDTAFADELLELAVVCGELVDDQFTRKTRELGERMGKALRLVGMGPPASPSSRTSPTTSGPTDSTPSSSTDGPESSDGGPTSPSTPSSPSSTDSPASPSASATSEKPSEPVSA